MKNLVPIVCILLVAGGVLFAICHSPCPVESEYHTEISVETPDKIENAISNVVADLEKRDFIPVNLEVKWFPANKNYVIYVKGIDRTKLGKYEP